MNNVPVLIPTLNRLSHLQRCIESLKKNTYANFVDLFISLDYPPSKKYEEGYRAVKQYLEQGIEGFANVNIYMQEHNLGPLDNWAFLIEKAYERYDFYVFTEDDNEFSPCFVEFMARGIEEYRDDNSVFAICASATSLKGYDGKSDLVKVNYFSAHGFAIWKNREDEFRKIANRSYIEDVCCSKSKMKRLYENDSRTIPYLASTLLRKESIYQTADGSIPPIDTTRMIHLGAEQKYIIASAFPMVRNWGFDGSGVNCDKVQNNLSTRPIREDAEFDITDMEPCVCKVDPRRNAKSYILLLSAYLRIWLWRIISKHKMHE